MQATRHLRYSASAQPAHTKSTMHALVYALVNSAIWLGVALIAWPLLAR